MVMNAPPSMRKVLNSIADGDLSGLDGAALPAFISRRYAVKVSVAFTEVGRGYEATCKCHVDDGHAGLQ
jgi:hypothetical protein